MFDFGFKKSKKQRNRERVDRTQAIGRFGEEMFKISRPFDYVERTGKGHDYRVRPFKGVDLNTMRPRYGRPEYHEVKTRGMDTRDLLGSRNPSRPKLSPLQKKTKRRMKKKGIKYVVDEYNAPY